MQNSEKTYSIKNLESQLASNKDKRERLSRSIARLDSWLTKNKKKADPRTVQKVRNKIDALSKKWFHYYKLEASCKRGIKFYYSRTGRG